MKTGHCNPPCQTSLPDQGVGPFPDIETSRSATQILQLREVNSAGGHGNKYNFAPKKGTRDTK